MNPWLKVAVIAVVFLLVTGASLTFYVAWVVFRRIFVRTSPELWTRANSEPGNNEDHDKMHEMAVAWNSAHSNFIKEVSIENDGLMLTGQYFDFGFQDCVIILSGRTEGCVYSSGFSAPYVACGYNVLVPDNRAHGNSQGKYVTMGYREHRDLLKWMAFAHDQLNNRSVVLHGVCVGAATCVYAASAPDAPAYIKCITVEGLYESFYDVLRRRIISRGHRTFPVLQWLWLITRIKYGVNYRKFTPGSCIGRIQVPMLFIQSKEDRSTLPETCEKMYRLCGSSFKRIFWAETGSHSHIRMRHMQEYDNAIIDFLQDTGNRLNFSDQVSNERI